MIHFDRKPQLLPLLAGLAMWLVSTLAAADHLKMREDGVAILGYDTVAYFTARCKASPNSSMSGTDRAGGS